LAGRTAPDSVDQRILPSGPAQASHPLDASIFRIVNLLVVPSLVFDVTDVWPDYKNGLAAYQSQFFGADDAPSTALSGSGFLEALEARGRHYGAMVNARYGEPYISPVPLRVDSPVSLLRPAGAKASDGSYR
jgi:hypothetical protein